MSVWPSIFLYAKNTQNLGETGPSVPVFISMASDQLLSPSEVGRHSLAGVDPSNSNTATCTCGECVCTRSRQLCAGACAHVRPFVRDVPQVYRWFQCSGIHEIG